MKKALILTIVIAILTLSFSGCANTEPKEKYTLKLSGFSDSIPQLSSTQEYDAWRKPDYTDPSRVGKTLSISIGDMQFEGTYRKSEQIVYNNYYDHYYKFGLNYFSVNDEGELESLSLVENLLSEMPEEDAICTEEECREIALDLAKKVFDISNYTITYEYIPMFYSHRYYFNKYINGFKCADEIFIDISVNGQILTFASYMRGEMPTEDVNVNFDLEEIKKQIQVRLEERYAYFDGEYAIDFEIQRTVLTLDEDDNYVLAITIGTDLKTKPETGKPLTVYREGLTFAVLEN